MHTPSPSPSIHVSPRTSPRNKRNLPNRSALNNATLGSSSSAPNLQSSLKQQAPASHLHSSQSSNHILATSPTRPQKKLKSSIYSDRHIPNRSGINFSAAFSLATGSNSIYGAPSHSCETSSRHSLAASPSRNGVAGAGATEHYGPTVNAYAVAGAPPALLNEFNPPGPNATQEPATTPNRPGSTDTIVVSPPISSPSNQDPIHVRQKLAHANATYSTLLKAELFGSAVPSVGSNINSVHKQANLSLGELSSSALNNRPAITAPSKTLTATPQHNGNIFQYKSLNLKKVTVPFSVEPSTPDTSFDFSFDHNDVDPPSPSANAPSDSLSLLPTTPTSSIKSTMPSYSLSPSPESPESSYRTRLNLNLLPLTRPDPLHPIYSSSPISLSSQRLLLSRASLSRTVSRVPYKVLDAPELADDFYLNLVHWGSQNMLAVALGSKVYVWDAATSNVTCLCDLSNDSGSGSSFNSTSGGDAVTSVSWIKRGTHLAVGTRSGLIQIWDANRARRVRCMTGHTKRVGALAWNDHILTSGSRDRSIIHRDVRVADHYTYRVNRAHKQEVCGLKWSHDSSGGRGLLASGGNDNRLAVWDSVMATNMGGSPSDILTSSSSSSSTGVGNSSWKPLYRFSDHKAAVKALAWSPHQRHLLASGGGTADRRIRFWDMNQGTCVQELDTGSQVCCLEWSQHNQELISTHGYSQNALVVWKYPTMTQTAVLKGHTSRVLYMAMSPDGKSVATGAGDETLRFWKIWGDSEETKRSQKISVLDVFPKLR